MSERFRSAVVIGTGMMGPGIAVTLALGGVRSTILSREADRAQQALDKALSQVHLLREHGLVEHGRAHRAQHALSASADFEPAIAAADLVIESAPENLDFKRDLFARMDGISKPEAVLASNTSGLSITAVAARCSRPERVLTTHFWNPPHLMPLVEVVHGDKTDTAIALAVRDLLAACGKVPVMVKKDRPGQLGNRLQMALWREAVHVVAEGIAAPEDVDLAAKCGFGLRLPVYGIFEHADAVGLEMVRDIMDYVSRDLYCEPKAPPLMDEKVARGDTGARAGRGFYDWSKKSLAEVIERRDRFVLDFLKAAGRR
jgi:3-hydroxybutyryl-CoA dehydrogenase